MNLFKTVLLFILLSNFACSQTLVWEKTKRKKVLTNIVELDKTVIETSGFVQVDSTFWTINDSGDASYLYHVDPTNGKIIKRIDIKRAKNQDWEALTIDDRYLYIGDIGNNKSDRKQLTIYKVKQSDLLKAKKEIKDHERITFSYPADRTSYDCEAMIILDEKIWLFTKNRGKMDTHIYTIPNRRGHYTANYEGGFQADGLITAAHLFEDQLVLLGYTDKPNYLPFIWTFEDFSSQKLNKLKGKETLITPVLQFESILTRDKNSFWLTCEGSKKRKQEPGLWELKL